MSLLASGKSSDAQQEVGPVFLLQPGLLTTDFVSAPAGETSATGFNLSFETRFPTSVSWLTPVIGASVTPNGTNGVVDRGVNAPVLFAGNVFPVVGPRLTAGWLTLEAPLLLYYSYGGGGQHNPRVYGGDLFMQIALFVHLGSKTLKDMGSFWSRLDAYASLGQNLTPNEDPRVGKRDRFNPVALFGVSTRFGGRRTS
jgi:hypothetical protein